ISSSHFILFISFIAFSQEHCNYLVTLNSENLKDTGKFKLFIKSTDDKSFRIRKEVNFCNMRLNEFELYDEKTKSFDKIHLGTKDIDCFTYNDKYKKLKPNETYTYNVDIKSDFEVLRNSKFFETYNDRKYRFKISFNLDSYDRCGESNTLITDWIYKN
ncbi:hypothetical protein, partial [Epilithonimonas hominis]|uniref:hypothetical protein n=1 Tax=Epilithonimonas hominis TaxID=420404 RepID=UPI001C832C7E